MAWHGMRIGAAVQCDARHRGEILLGHWWSRGVAGHSEEFAETVLREIRCFLDPYSMSPQDLGKYEAIRKANRTTWAERKRQTKDLIRTDTDQTEVMSVPSTATLSRC